MNEGRALLWLYPFNISLKLRDEKFHYVMRKVKASGINNRRLNMLYKIGGWCVFSRYYSRRSHVISQFLKIYLNREYLSLMLWKNRENQQIWMNEKRTIGIQNDSVLFYDYTILKFKNFIFFIFLVLDRMEKNWKAIIIN